MRLRITPREEMLRRWAEAIPPEPTDERPPERARNLHAVLDLGNTVYIQFRGRPYGIPNPPYKKGLAVMDAYLEAMNCPQVLTPDTLPQYTRAIEKLAHLLRGCLEPGGSLWGKIKYKLRIWNPLKDASEGDIVELAVFTLGRRMKSSGIAADARHRLAPRT